MLTCIIGVDCAAQPGKTGIAFGWRDQDYLFFDSLLLPHRLTFQQIADRIAEYAKKGDRVLLAFDAPLGWPRSLSEELWNHHAGDRIKGDPDELFSRMTDRFVRDKTGIRPLEVGANLIARTSRSALELLALVVEKLEIGFVPVVAGTGRSGLIEVVEVFPKLQLWALGLTTDGYKGTGDKEKESREKLVMDLIRHKETGHVHFEGVEIGMILDDNLLDAALCVLAGYDFLGGNCFPCPPKEEILDQAFKEGWIWFRPRPYPQIQQ